ncbi:MAG TPA: helix-turn-helix transcriptional regulator [Bryobacteraceae bacterium]|nr:helix-turn-helix transcriptional regulator [Bryobacteraceae bacterium]
MERRLTSYLRSYRLRWGLTQLELAYLVGLVDASAISRIEEEKRLPPLYIAFALQVLFGVAPRELFPGLFSDIEDAVLRRAYTLYEKLQGTPTKRTKTKLDLLEEVLARAKARQIMPNV